MKVYSWWFVLGMAFLLTANLMFYVTFLYAYFNDGQITIYINNYGEGDIELLLLTFSMPLVFYTCYYAIKLYIKNTPKCNI